MRRPVAEALRRLASLVERAEAGWMVGSDNAGATTGTLAGALYARWYTQPEQEPPPARDDPPLYSPSLLPALRAATPRPPPEDRRWTVTGSEPRGTISAARDEATRVLRPGDYVLAMRPGVPPAPGEPVEVVTGLEHLDAERGLWWMFGSTIPEPPLGRVYVNVRPATAARAVHELATALAPLAFQLKCPVLAAACQRVDAVVLYHARSDRPQVLAALDEHWPRLGPLLDPAVPPLTCPIRPGLAWADDLDASQSYGERQCGILAAAIDDAAMAWPETGVAERVTLLVDALRKAGMNPECPWEAAS